jgi:hypothetical protein
MAGTRVSAVSASPAFAILAAAFAFGLIVSAPGKTEPWRSASAHNVSSSCYPKYLESDASR